MNKTTMNPYTASAFGPYQMKFKACLRSWLMGLLTGIPVGGFLSFLFGGFEFNLTLLVLCPFTVLSSVMVMSAVFGMNYTSDFGLSCIPLGLFQFGRSILDIFSGMWLLVWIIVLILSVVGCCWVGALLIFSFLFPLETLYYGTRAFIEKASV